MTYDEMVNSGSPLPSMPRASIMQGVLNQPGMQPATSSAQPGAGSSIDQLLSGLYRPPTTGDYLSDLGSVAGAFSSGQKANRITEGNFTQGYDQMMLGNELDKNKLALDAMQQRNLNEADALRKLQQTSYIMGGGAANNQPAQIQLGGKMVTLPSFSFAAKGPSADDITGATSLHGQMLDRLKDASFHPNFSYTPTPLSEYAKPGMAEQIGSYAGSGLGALGAIDNMMGVGKTAGNVMNMVGKIPGLGSVGNVGSKIGSFLGGSAGNTAGASGAGAAGAATGLLGKAVPIAGAVTGGLGLIHDHGLGGNIMNGVSAGASLGSIVPGLGTAVGAGIGAGVGALRSLFNIGGPSKEELAGRDAHSSIINSMTAGATPEEIQEAHNSGWEKPQDALALITLRDRMNQKGLDSSKANALMDQLFKATKIGPQAVSNVYNQIAQVMS